jgi:branched-chain amino acid transport system permease protein
MQAYLDIFDIYLLEAVINGILLGGVLALLALGLNLIFGVIDVTWICYAELVMIGMYAFGIDFRNLGIRLPVLALGEMNFSYARLLSFGAALFGMIAVYLFMTRTFTGTAIRAISQDRQIMSLMGVDTRRIYLITSALGGALAGLAACLLVLQYDVHPFVGLSFGPITFLICVLGGLGNFIGGFIAAFIFAEIISLGGLFSDLEWGYVLAFAFFIVMMFIRPAGLLARRR